MGHHVGALRRGRGVHPHTRRRNNPLASHYQLVVPRPVYSQSPLFVLPGPDWQPSYLEGKVYYVAEVTVHPQFDGSIANPSDIAVVRYLGVPAATPLIPPLSLAEDQLTTGSPFTLVGYGKTETNADNSQRPQADKVVLD